MGKKDQSTSGKPIGRGGWGHGGPPTNCVCPKCGFIVPRKRGVPCYKRQCPHCGSFMARQFLDIE